MAVFQLLNFFAMRHFDLQDVLGLDIGLKIGVEAVLQAVSFLESNYLFAMSGWSKYGIHKGLFLWPIIWVALTAFVFGLEQALQANFASLGLYPGQLSGVWHILTFPLIHGDFNHLFSNAISLFFVGTLLRYSFPKIFDRVWLLAFILPGIGLWFIGRPNFHIGASAWLYALVSFIFFSGILRLHVKLLAQSMLMVFLYGSFLWGVLPHDPTISWEGHLSGAIVGLLLALYYRKTEPIEALRDQPLPHEEVAWDDWKDPIDQDLNFQEVKGAPRTPSKPPLKQQFRYEDGSAPDEWV
jgi:membrane associated rhomboid family serine protease